MVSRGGQQRDAQIILLSQKLYGFQFQKLVKNCLTCQYLQLLLRIVIQICWLSL